MSEACAVLHQLANKVRRHQFPFDRSDLPSDGIYLLFEEGEGAHGGRRIVRIGTHTGPGQLAGRLEEHFLKAHKDRSIFRKNIGRALLHRDSDPFLEQWELDLTSRENRDRYADQVDTERQADIEHVVTDRIRRDFSFSVVPAKDKAERLAIEKSLIGTISSCKDCRPSTEWLGLYSPKPKIRDSGLWQEQHLNAPGLPPDQVRKLFREKADMGARRERTAADGKAHAGSQRQVQIWVDRFPDELSRAVAAAIGPEVPPDQIEWRAPLKRERFREPLDRDFLEALDLGEYTDQLAGFWPKSGPRWDALAVLRSPDSGRGVLLVEGKSYPAEMAGPGMQAKDDGSVRTIREALAWTKGVLGADRRADWTGKYYQYANRLAHLCFLRYELGVQAWLANLCFIGDERRPTSQGDWIEQLHQIEKELGFPERGVPFTVDVLLPAREPEDW